MTCRTKRGQFGITVVMSTFAVTFSAGKVPAGTLIGSELLAQTSQGGLQDLLPCLCCAGDQMDDKRLFVQLVIDHERFVRSTVQKHVELRAVVLDI